MTALGVDDPGQRARRKAFLPRIREAEGDEIVAAIEPLHRLLKIQVEIVGDDKNDSALRADAFEKKRGAIEVCGSAAAPHRRIDRRMHDHLRVCSAAPRRQETAHRIGKQEQTNTIRILYRRKSEYCRQLRGNIALAPV